MSVSKHIPRLVVAFGLCSSAGHAIDVQNILNQDAVSFEELLSANVQISKGQLADPVAVNDKISVGDLLVQDALKFSAVLGEKETTVKLLVETPEIIQEAMQISTSEPVETEQIDLVEIELEESEPEVILATVLPSVVKTVVTNTPAIDSVDSLIIDLANNKLQISQQILDFDRVGKSLAVVINQSVEASLFVRDNTILDWDFKTSLLKAVAIGETELYVVHGKQMEIIKVKIGGGNNLQVPTDLVSLDGVFNAKTNSALFPNASASNEGAVGKSDALADSQAATQQFLEENSYVETVVSLNTQKIAYRNLSIQVVDERSVVEAGKIYPVVNTRVKVLGTEFEAVTDSTGHVTIPDMPLNSRFMIAVDSNDGVTYPTTVEINTFTDTELFRIKVSRRLVLDAIASITGEVQDSNYGSICSVVVDASRSMAPVSAVEVVLDVSAAGPYYFNRYGYLDLSMRTTGEDGKFCFFNVPVGPVAVRYFYENKQFAMTPIAITSGNHLEQKLAVGQSNEFFTRLVATPTAHEQLGSNIKLANEIRDVDFVELVSFGSTDALQIFEEGVVYSLSAVGLNQNRRFLFSVAPEFEPVVYSFSTEAKKTVTQLFPRGYLEDMSLYAQVVLNQGMGTVMVEHADLSGQGKGETQLLLYDQFNNQIDSGWVYQDTPTTKAIYFNLPVGVYQLVAKTSDGYWINADTVYVYSDTMSYIRSGSPLSY